MPLCQDADMAHRGESSDQIRLTDRDLGILEVLTRRVRVLTVAQISRTWWGGDGTSGATSRLATLAAGGFVRRLRFNAHPELQLLAPVVTWRPGLLAPQFGPLAYALAGRWSRPDELTPAVVATRLAATRVGGEGGRVPRPSEVSHDITFSGVYLRLRATQPERAALWLSEGQLYRQGWGRDGRLPDALIDDPAERTVIELAGTYPKKKLEAFHRFCEEEELGYELW